MNRQEIEKNLRLISRAWGKKQSGYAFFPYIDRTKQLETGSRKAGFTEGPAFKWPQEREKIIEYCLSHTGHDLYWSASLFEYPKRDENLAMDEHALWADLDESDPNLLDEYRPTIAWESSPGRYQALWVAASGDFQGASWPGNENQRMTYLVGADPSGWDTVQLLRMPGWVNHKPEYLEKYGKYPKGKILWSDGPTYHPGDFADLPEVAGVSGQLTDAIEAEIDNVDRHAVIARIKLKLNRRAREMLLAREVSGDRSGNLWYLIRCLADVGCTTAEIVAIVRDTVWNKFAGRGDELKRLILEASKAIAQKADEPEPEEPEEIERDAPQRLSALLKGVKRPKYIIENVLTEAACGFIAGEPKCYKSWVGLEMALSVSTGAPFLGHFRVVKPGPVLYIQEEDPATIVKERSAKIWISKGTDKLQLVPDTNELLWLPPEKEAEFDPDIGAYIQRGVVLSDEAWQLWLDDIIAEGLDGVPYSLMLVDTLMMAAGDVDENRSQEMTNKIFRPLKTLARKHGMAVQLIAHMGKGDKPRAGQRLLGSVANHAWSEDSIYLSRSGTGGNLKMEIESKAAPGGTYRITNLANRQWTPEITPWRPEDEDTPSNAAGDRATRNKNRGPRAKKKHELVTLIEQAGSLGMTTQQVADAKGVTRSTAHRSLNRLADSEDSPIERRPLQNGSYRWVVVS